jgi:hypothetical protein
MAAQVSIQTVDALGAEIYVSFNVALSGNYPAGGDVLNFTSGGVLPATQDPAYIGLVAAVESSQLLQMDVWSQGGNLARDYTASKVSVNPATGAKIKMNSVRGASTELTAGAYPADVTADTVTGFAIFTKML